MLYLDRSATTPVRREVLEAMWPYLTGAFGNPSSTHGIGRAAGEGLADARRSAAELLGCRASDVVFTAGGTEGANLAIKGISLATPRGRHLVTTAIEHEAVLASCDYLVRHHGFTTTRVELDADGRIDPAALAAAIRDDTTLVTVAHANNEIGTVQDIPTLAAIAHAAGAAFHVDAVQSAPWYPVGLDVLGADAVSVSGHKLGAPKGIGALAVHARVPLEPLVHGGGQERGRRSGTENVAGSVAFGRAAELVLAERTEDAERAARLRDVVIDGVLAAVPGAVLTGSRAHRLPGHASFCFPGAFGETVLLELEQDDIISSSGSACAAGSTEPSHVLTALGFDEDLARTGVRLTFDATLSDADARATVSAVAGAVAAVRALG